MIPGLRRVVSSLELCYGALFVRMRLRSGLRDGNPAFCSHLRRE